MVVNGMSLARRDSPFANSGIVVGLEPADVAALGYAGTARRRRRCRRRSSARAWEAGGGGAGGAGAAARRFRRGSRERRPAALLAIGPACARRRLDEVLPPFIADASARRASGASASSSAATTRATPSWSASRRARRARSASRATRRRSRRPDRPDVYPCGEGAGYAGGIVSAALDGIAVADAVARPRWLALSWPSRSGSGRAALRDGAEAVGADAERQVDQVVVVLERVQPRDLDDLAVVEVPAERRRTWRR